MGDRFPVPRMAMEFLKKKVRVPTDKWDDLKWGEHAHAFTVAHSCEADVLNDIHGFLNKAMADGESFGAFKKKLLSMMAEKGWYGGDGHKADEKKYINWRARLMYDTNMKTAYAQAHYRKQLQGSELRPVWVYRSKLVGDNRRADHIALHGRAFRYDDSFWDTYYPPNGWGCECYVTTESEAGAEREGLEVLGSGEDGSPPPLRDGEGKPVDWNKFGDPSWKYNVGREALAPNFSRYKNLPAETLKQVYAKYHASMDGTRMTEGEFKTLAKRANEEGYKPLDILYQVGNLEAERYGTLRKAGIPDSKIMATDRDLRHGTGAKTDRQKIPESLFDEIYKLLQEPEMIYEENKGDRPYKTFHFVKDMKDGKKLKIVLYQRKLKDGFTSLKITTMGYGDYEYTGKKYKKIW